MIPFFSKLLKSKPVQIADNNISDSTLERLKKDKIPITGRELSEYEKIFGLTPDFFKKGDIVLDNGSGYSQNLARNLDKLGVTTFSVDPSLIYFDKKKESRFSLEKRADKNGQYHPLTVAALARNLPFKDSSFDKVLALYSVPMYSESREIFLQELSEMLRVTASGGEILISPINIFFDKYHKGDISFIETFLKNQPEVEFKFKDNCFPGEKVLVIKKK